MILISHGIIGAAVGRLFPAHPLLAFLAGMATHYAMDAIPHWEYKLLSVFRDDNTGFKKARIGIRFAIDILSALLDLLAGGVLSFLIFSGDFAGDGLPASLIAGIIGGILPDGFQFLHMLFPKFRLLATHQTFHNRIHARRRLNDRPLVGIPLQAAIVTLWVVLSKIAR